LTIEIDGRHCEERSNPEVYRAPDCFVPRNDVSCSVIAAFRRSFRQPNLFGISGVDAGDIQFKFTLKRNEINSK
jgi:hypothetical protein